MEGISGSPPGPDMGGAPRVVHRPLSTYCLRHAVAPRRPSYRIVERVQRSRLTRIYVIDLVVPTPPLTRAHKATSRPFFCALPRCSANAWRGGWRRGWMERGHCVSVCSVGAGPQPRRRRNLQELGLRFKNGFRATWRWLAPCHPKVVLRRSTSTPWQRSQQR